MLDRGDIDACTAIRQGGRVTAGDSTVIDRYGGTPINGNPHLRKLLDDNGRGVVYEYYRKTGFFHANHNVIVQNRILKDHPWVALELFNAFQRSKEAAYERARRSQSAYLYFACKDFQEQATVLGEDPYPTRAPCHGKKYRTRDPGLLGARVTSQTPAARGCVLSDHPEDLAGRCYGNTTAELYDLIISSYVGCGIPDFQVGSRSSSILPLGSRKYSSRPGKEALLTARQWAGRYGRLGRERV